MMGLEDKPFLVGWGIFKGELLNFQRVTPTKQSSAVQMFFLSRRKLVGVKPTKISCQEVRKKKRMPHISSVSLYIQTPPEVRYLDPKNIPIKHQTSGGMTGCLGL